MHGQGDGHGRIEVRPRDAAGYQHAEGDRQAPPEVDRQVGAVGVAAEDDLGDDTDAEGDEHGGPEELGGHFAKEIPGHGPRIMAARRPA